MNCQKCGNEIQENQKFCPNCGAKLNDSDTWIEKHYKKVIIGAISGILLFCICIIGLNVNKSPNANNMVTEQENITDEEIIKTIDEQIDSEDAAEDITRQPTAPKPKCVYETKDGVCFTTKVFKPEPLTYYDCLGGLTTTYTTTTPIEKYRNIGIYSCYHYNDHWAGAMKQCSDWGYKMPSDYELTSLASDIYGAPVSNDIGILSGLPPRKQVNKNIISLLGMEKFFDEFYYWEDTEINENNANARRFYTYNTIREREGVTKSYANYSYTRAICVYNPYGKAKSSYTEYVSKQQQQIKEQQQQKQEQMKKEAEDALF